MSIEPAIGILVNDPNDQDGYFKAVHQTKAVRSGAVKVRQLKPQPNYGEIEGLLGVVVTGVGHDGRNVHPALYNANVSPNESIPDTDYDADLRVLTWLSMFDAYGVPVVGTCLGLQLICVGWGGMIKAGIPGHTGSTPDEHTTTTTVSLTEGSLLTEIAGHTTLDVVCMHSQGAAVPPTPPRLIVTGRSADGEIHAVESRDGRVIATQFHPEKMESFGPFYYNALIERWRRWR